MLNFVIHQTGEKNHHGFVDGWLEFTH